MRIYRRGKKGIFWLQAWGTRQSLETSDREAAQRRVKQLELERADPAFAAAQGRVLGEACKEFLATAATAGNRAKPPSAATLEMWGYHVITLTRLLGGDSPLDSITPAAVERYIGRRRAEKVRNAPSRLVTAATVSKELATLRKVLATAKRLGWWPGDVAATVPLGGAGTRTLDRALTLDEVPRLLAALAPREDRVAIVCFLTGLGADVAALPRAELADFGRASVLVRGSKTPKRFARVPIMPVWAPYVERARRWLVTEGRFLPWRNAVRDLARACETAELPRITPRDLRRTFGRVLRAQGVPPHLLGELLRHSDGRMAERVYGTLSPEALGELAIAAAQGYKLGTSQAAE